MNLYVFEYGSKVFTEKGKIKIEKDDVIIGEYPVEIIESLTISSRCQITSQCLEKLSDYGVNILWVGYAHNPMGILANPEKCNILRQKAQFEMLDNSAFRLAVIKNIITAKVSNQRTVLKRYCRDKTEVEYISEIIDELKIYMNKLETADDPDVVMGYEGYCSRRYFDALKKIVPSGFDFEERTKNPPRDKFSALLSFLYTLLFNEIMICVTNAGLNPHIGFMHELKNNHPGLVSDLIEEWRGVAADTVALKLVLNDVITPSDFDIMPDGAVYLNRLAAKEAIRGFEKKMLSENSYVRKEGFGNTYRDSLGAQTAAFCNALETDNPELYKAVIIR